MNCMIKNKLIKIKERIKKMFDKRAKNAYVWYSGATDITGIKLADAIDADHGREKPDFSKYDLIIGWGTKINKDISFGKMKTLNSPVQILANRDKFEALKLMHNKKVSVAGFVDAAKVIVDIKDKKNGVKFPLIGRTKYHQGGKGFWLCPTMTHIRAALDDGAKYFQNMIEIKNEYRLHVFNGKVIYAVKKSKKSKEEYLESYITQELDAQKNLAEKNNNPFDEATARLIIERMAKKRVADGADMIIRSNKKGWKFSHVKTVDKALEHEAVKALKSLDLDFGAVDCCIDVNNVPYIIEINTGPGLEKTPFDAYVKAFKGALVSPPVVKETVKHNEYPAESAPATNTVKKELLAKTALFTELVEKANEDEAKALKGVFKKMFD